MSASTTEPTAASTTGRASLTERFDAVMMRTYASPPVALVRGQGCQVWDERGRAYLDLVAGIAVSALGHAHPAIVAAVAEQVATIAHTSNLVANRPSVQLAERLVEIAGRPARVFFANSGAEANEAALKLVLRRAGQRGRPGGYVVAATDGFHGRTLGALSLTGKAAIRDPFGPFGVDVRFVPFGDPVALASAVDGDCVAVFMEPTQGEAGVVPAPPGYLAAARDVCDRNSVPLVFDEVQSGIGRTGAWFAHQDEGVPPDVLTLAKGLGGGLPIGACLAFGELADTFGPGDHGSTFGGNPVSCAAALAVLRTIEEEHLLDHVKRVSTALAGGLEAVDHPVLGGVRGRGLWLGIALTAAVAPAVEAAARQAGFLVNAVRPDTVRLAPPLVLSETAADAFVAALPAVLAAATTDRPSPGAL